jgi:HSP20 family molecular chaperone IbpA
MTGTIRFARIVSRTDQIAAELRRLQFSQMQPPAASWSPAVNVYLYADHLDVCIDLAGVPRKEVQVEVGPRRLVVRGHRMLPGSSGEGGCCGRILVMEIPDGSFERTIEFALDIDTSHVEARQEDGWLWIRLPKAQRGAV